MASSHHHTSLNRDRGFTLVELIIVVAVIGIIAAVMIPNLIDALHKARQKRTVADVRSLGSAWLSWLADHTGAASSGAAKTYNSGDFVDVDFATLTSDLRPTDTFFYMQELPQKDGWGFDLRFAMGLRRGIVDRILVCAQARDGAFDGCAQGQIAVEPFLTTDYDQDIVWADGFFIRWPSGLKR